MKSGALMVVVCAGCAGTCLGQHQGDILLTVVDGRIATGAVNPDGTTDPDERVFLSRFGAAFPNFADSPGCDSRPGTFPVPSAIGFRILKALRAWDGAGFTRIPEETVEIAFGPLGPAETPAADVGVTGFTVGVGSNGQWHRHYEYTLTEPAGAGVYLLEMSLWSTSAEVGESRPYWIVFSQNADDATAAAAAAWVRSNKLCPADFNADGFIDFFDYDDYVACFEGGVCPAGKSADFNDDGFADFFDYDAFVAGFGAGCS